MRLVEVWGWREQYDRWMEETIQPAIQEVAADVAARPSSSSHLCRAMRD